MGIFKSGDEIQTIHGDTGVVVGFLNLTATPGQRTAAVRLDAGYNVGISESSLIAR